MSDSISRADAVRLLVERYKFTTSEATEILSALPSAENSNAKTQNSNQETQNSNGDLIYRADAVQGEWIDVNGDGSLWRCDQCEDTACCDGNYCPNCGAKMTKGGDSE